MKTTSFIDVFDNNLASILVTYLTFDECMASLSLLNKQYNKFMKEGGVDYIWKGFFTQEFLHLDYVDHKRANNETYFQYFKRSFGMYKHVRKLLTEIIEKSNEFNDDE